MKLGNASQIQNALRLLSGSWPVFTIQIPARRQNTLKDPSDFD